MPPLKDEMDLIPVLSSIHPLLFFFISRASLSLSLSLSPHSMKL